MKKPTKVSQKIKTKNHNYDLLAEQKNKRGPTSSIFEDEIFNLPPKEYNSRVDLNYQTANKENNEKKSSISIASKSTNFSSKEKDSLLESYEKKEEKVGLSETTKNIIAKCLQKKGKKPTLFLPGMQPKSTLKESFFSKSSEKINQNNEKKDAKNNKNEPPKLSENCLAIIEKLNKKKEIRENRFQREEKEEEKNNKKRSESCFDLKFKYEELLKGELPLPLKYKNLLNSFETLEKMINLNKYSAFKKNNTLENLIISIESYSHRNFSLKILQQILYVVPHFYILKYQKKQYEGFNNSKNKYDLIIEIPKDYLIRQNKNYEPFFDFSSILFPKNFDYVFSPIPQEHQDQRIKIFKEKLLQIVNYYHLRFLEDKKYPIFEALKQKTWHHEFILEECADIPMFIIQNIPKENQLINKEILENDLKKDIMNNAMDLINNFKISQKEQEEINKQKKELSKFVSNEFIDKLIQKEQVNKYASEINNFNYQNNLKNDNKNLYKNILITMKTLLIVNENRVTGYELSEMINDLRNSSVNIMNSFTQKELANVLKKIGEKYSDLLKIKFNSAIGKYVVVMNLNMEIPEEIIID